MAEIAHSPSPRTGKRKEDRKEPTLAVLRSAAVVGAGPAGLSAALALTRRGVRVTVFEQRPACAERVCGAFLNPEAVSHLKWLDVYSECLKEGAVPVRRAVVTSSGGASAEIPAGDESHPALAFPRPALERVLLKKLQDAGGEIRWGARVKTVRRDDPAWRIETSAQSISTDVVVSASGRFSEKRPVAESAGWYGWNARFSGVRQRPGDLSLHFFPGGYVGVLTFADGDSNVCGLIRRSADQTKQWPDVFQEALSRQPSLRRCLEGAERAGEWRGVGPLPFSFRMRNANGPLLAGDAAAVGDPFLGEGIGRALGAGPLLDEALRTGDAIGRAYAALFILRALFRREHLLSRALAVFRTGIAVPNPAGRTASRAGRNIPLE
jgi:menaquinone-9 beta-reductase